MDSKELKQLLANGGLDEKLLEIYGDKKLLAYQRDRYIKTIERFERNYGEGEVSVFSIPGRSEVSGNHTDHQHGKVLACSINLDILAVARESDHFEIISDNRHISNIDIENLTYSDSDPKDSRALVRGVLAALKQDGYKLGNINAVMTSDVLVGSGLSSSAAFEIAVATIMSDMFNDGKIDRMTQSKASMYAENVYFGKPSGLMDQCACCFGGLVYIDFLNYADPYVEQIELDLNKHGYKLCIVNTFGSHANLTHEYAAIPDEMRMVANYFGKDYLTEITKEDVLNNIPALRKAANDRAILRSLHMLEENDRVAQQVVNLHNDDFEAFLSLIKESGESSYKYLQNVYYANDKHSETLALALKLSDEILGDKGVARVHGGGFEGTIQAFVADEAVEEYAAKMNSVFGEGACLVLTVNQFGGYQVI